MIRAISGILILSPFGKKDFRNYEADFKYKTAPAVPIFSKSLFRCMAKADLFSRRSRSSIC
jgi:hypothetical protein